jgi:WD40 repeat protein
VGMTNGGMSIMDGTTLAFVKWVKTFESAVADVKFSPDGEFLAAASHDLFIDVFSVSKGYTKLGMARACAPPSSRAHDRPAARRMCGTRGCSP